MTESLSEKSLWNAARILTLGVVDRLQYNRNRYNAVTSEKVPTEKLLETIDRILINLHSYQNMYHHATSTEDTAFLTGSIVLIHKIDNDLYQLHHLLLEEDADQILPIIQLLDSERGKWNPEHISHFMAIPDLVESSQSIQTMFEIRAITDRSFSK